MRVFEAELILVSSVEYLLSDCIECTRLTTSFSDIAGLLSLQMKFKMSPTIRSTIIAVAWILASTSLLALVAATLGEPVGIAMFLLFTIAGIGSFFLCLCGETIVEDAIKVAVFTLFGFISWLAIPIDVPLSFGIASALLMFGISSHFGIP